MCLIVLSWLVTSRRRWYAIHYNVWKRREFHSKDHGYRHSRRHLLLRFWVRYSAASQDRLLIHVVHLSAASETVRDTISVWQTSLTLSHEIVVLGLTYLFSYDGS